MGYTIVKVYMVCRFYFSVITVRKNQFVGTMTDLKAIAITYDAANREKLILTEILRPWK